MKPNPLLNESIAVFKELGWHTAQYDEILNLPLGTVEQQRRVVQGLETGDWGEYGRVAENSYGWISAHTVNDQMLALFALRCGVSARRAEELITTDDEVTFSCIIQRGRVFAAQFLESYYRSVPRMHEHTLSVKGALGVALALFTENAPLENLDYLKDWVVLARYALTGQKRDMYREGSKLPFLDDLLPTFKDHVFASVENGVAATGPLKEVLAALTNADIITRDELIKVCVRGLDLAVRPGDRKAYTQLLVEDLQLDTTELLANQEVFKNVLTSGETPVVEAFAPSLIAVLSPAEAAEIALTSLYAKAAKTRLQVLKAVEQRQDVQTAEALILADRLNELAASKEKPSARIAKKLLENWNLATTPVSEKTSDIKGLWNPTPPLWEVPEFILGEVSVTALAHVINFLRTDEQYLFDIEGDRLLALAVELAREDVAQVRLALNGVKHKVWSPLIFSWLENNEVKLFSDDYLSHSQMVFAALGKIPCLLSTPSRLDSSVAFADLADRLVLYARSQAEVLESDLVLSLLRLDVSALGDEINLFGLPAGVPVRLMDGTVLDRDAAQVIRDYLADPLPEGSIDSSSGWLKVVLEMPQSLKGLQLPFRLNYMDTESTRLFPHWGAPAFIGMRWFGQEVSSAGLCADDASYRAKPLPAEAAINLLALQRPVHPKMADYCAEGIVNAWKRGLLIPGVADVAFLDWDSELSSLAALAKALYEVAQLGMLSVVWPVLDDLLGASMQKPRMVAGTAEVAEIMAELVDEVLVAVKTGVADEVVLEVPGVRALASRAGKSKAVEFAQFVVAKLPEAQFSYQLVAEPTRILPEEFEKIWQPLAGLVSVPEDGARICGFDEATAVSTCALPVIFETGNYPHEKFINTGFGWYYAITHEHQAKVVRVSADGSKSEGFIHWDGSQLVFSEYRNWRGGNSGALEGESSAFARFLVKIILADLATDPDPYSQRNIVRTLVREGKLDDVTVAATVSELVMFPQWSPARAVYLLESQPELLNVLWPMLTRPLGYAASQNALPRWVNRVLDIVLLHSEVLQEATLRGFIPLDEWQGVKQIAVKKGSSVAVKKAQEVVSRLSI
ncbi:hypothetical protein HMPREF0044_1416 [Gleimia coleocanis DSM 15436]|uniref:Uncharacterized protein n=1 Tax=Gleimia coleocanis DSM 15436 TaxID=525245 RepID=C0W1X6_9ACTO|nr:hypothetical protein [Gleimia coleocanis]EEH63492.1 hypothetical protein HMPREF0044_1416 [Gleimia coleocanis DSM 15436]